MVGKFVEFYGDGLDHLPLADRATIANMAPEYGATCGFFPIDDETLRYLRQTGRDEDADRAGRGLCQGTTACGATPDYDPVYTDTLELDMGEIVPAISGPEAAAGLPGARPRPARSSRRWSPNTAALDVPPPPGMADEGPVATRRSTARKTARSRERITSSRDGSVVIASITSCTNTSNPYVMIGAGLVARKAANRA